MGSHTASQIVTFVFQGHEGSYSDFVFEYYNGKARYYGATYDSDGVGSFGKIHETIYLTGGARIMLRSWFWQALPALVNDCTVNSATGAICFTGSSLLTLADGTSKSFRDLKVCERLLSIREWEFCSL